MCLIFISCARTVLYLGYVVVTQDACLCVCSVVLFWMCGNGGEI